MPRRPTSNFLSLPGAWSSHLLALFAFTLMWICAAPRHSDTSIDAVTSTATEVLEESRYYPYGYKIEAYRKQIASLPFAYNGAEEQTSFGLHLTTYRTMAPEVGLWGQTDPKAELMYAYSPYSSMAGNPISFNDPDGDVIPLLVFAGAALVGGGMNLYSNWSSVKSNPWSALGYFGSGAVGGAVSVVNPVLGGSIAAGGNVLTDVASGNLPDFSHWTDVAGYAGGVALDAVSVGGSGKIAKLGYNGLKGFGKDLAKDIITDQVLALELGSELGYQFARDAGGQIIWDGAAGALLTQVSGQATVIGQAINHAPGALAGLGAFGANVQLGAQNGWDINGPRTTAKWQGPGGQTYTKFGSDGTVWSKSWSNHGGESFKVFDQTGKGLKWKADADQFGNYIDGARKHKSDIGKSIPWNKLRKIF